MRPRAASATAAPTRSGFGLIVCEENADTMNARGLLHRSVDGARLARASFWRMTQAAIAAGIAWELAILLPGHARPFFAPIAAVVALGADRGRRGRQAVELVVGVVLGIATGTLVVLAAGAGAWQLVLATLAATTVATWSGGRPVVVTQAAASAILVVALHHPADHLALQRLVDAAIGGGIAILFAQVLFPVDPLKMLRDAMRALSGQLASALDEVAGALEDRDVRRAHGALRRIDRIDERRVYDVLAVGREVARRAPRRRRARRLVEEYGSAVRELSAATADARGLATGALRLLRTNEPTAGAADAVRLLADALRETSPPARLALLERAEKRLSAEERNLGIALVEHALWQVDNHLRAGFGAGCVGKHRYTMRMGAAGRGSRA